MVEQVLYESPEAIVSKDSAEILGQSFLIAEISEAFIIDNSQKLLRWTIIGAVAIVARNFIQPLSESDRLGFFYNPVLVIKGIGYSLLIAYSSIFEPTPAQITKRLIQTPNEIVGSQVLDVCIALLALLGFAFFAGLLALVAQPFDHRASVGLRISTSSSRSEDIWGMSRVEAQQVLAAINMARAAM